MQVFGCRHAETIHALWRPASEKRQGTKSRWVGHWWCGVRYGDLAAASVRRGFDAMRSAAVGFDAETCVRVELNERTGRLRDGIGGGDAGQSGGPTQAGALPGESPAANGSVSLRFGSAVTAS